MDLIAQGISATKMKFTYWFWNIFCRAYTLAPSFLLKEKNSKPLWEKVNWNRSVSSHDENEVPDLEDLKDQFQKKSETTDTSTLFSEVKKDQHVPVLDDEITVEEIQIAHKT